MIILDTQTLIWFISDPDKISKKGRRLIGRESKIQEILVSSISIWEIYLLIKKGRLKLDIHPDIWVEKVESLPFIRFIPVDNKIAAQSVNLPDPVHKDPADRMIIATALQEKATLITSDKKILDYKHVSTIW